MAVDKKFIAISNHDRLHNPNYQRGPIKIERVSCSLPVEVQVVKDGVVYQHTEYKEFDNQANANFKVSDFALENIIAVGHSDLNFTALERDSLSAHDLLSSQIDSITEPKTNTTN